MWGLSECGDLVSVCKRFFICFGPGLDSISPAMS